MKNIIKKSKVMKRAWIIFKGDNPYSYSFSAALRRAWFVEKADVVYQEKLVSEANEAARISALLAERRNNPIDIEHGVEFCAGAAAEYNNAPRGAYFGD